MGPAIQARPSDPSASITPEPSAPSERGPGQRRNDSRVERRIPSARETLQTLPDVNDSEFDFEPHDTIPAPTWLEDEISSPTKAP